MNSELIEYFRFDDEKVGILSGGKRYILAHKAFPVREVVTPINQSDLLKKLRNNFRYKDRVTEEEKWNTIKEISDGIKGFFLKLPGSGFQNCQFDVVMNASELALLPFELLLDEDGIPLFANEEKKLVFTRRFRQDFLEARISLPFKPHVLFAYSHGGHMEVPFENHLRELNNALKKWYGKKEEKILKVLDNPSFDEFSSLIKENSKKGTPFTHIHILGHGKLIQNEIEPEEFEYGIVFGNDKNKVTTAHSIKVLFESLESRPFLASFMICDGANFTNAMKVDKNPVQVTHKAGVPIVLGSQYPLSMPGSDLITRILYSSLFMGEDIREILYQIRCELFKRKEEHHDWISFVSYVRLPEGYEAYLFEVSLEWHMQDLKSLKYLTDELLLQAVFNEDDYVFFIAQLNQCIESLEALLQQISGKGIYEKECLENLGLLGSSYKRLSELYYHMTAKKGVMDDTSVEKQKSYLLKSLGYYKQACDKNLSHHWSTVQYLSLDVVCNGEINNPDYWYSARRSINISIDKDPNDEWAYGSQLELFLLSQNREDKSKEQCMGALNNLIKISKDKKDAFPLESTWHQLNRYKTWWTSNNGYQINPVYLIADAGFLTGIVDQLKIAIDQIKSGS